MISDIFFLLGEPKYDKINASSKSDDLKSKQIEVLSQNYNAVQCWGNFLYITFCMRFIG